MPSRQRTVGFGANPFFVYHNGVFAMFERLSNSWTLAKASAAVLKADKELLIFPLLSTVGVVIVTLTFAIPSFLAGLFDQGRVPMAGYIVAFLFYMAQYTVIIFANSAMVGAAMIRLEGGDPTVSDGFRIAFRHFGNILGYAAIAATVGLLLRWLSSRGRLGEIAASLVGLGWNMAVFLVVPVLVVEDLGPVEAVKRSARLLKKTWGEQIAGNFGLGLVFFLAILGIVVLGAGVTLLAVASQSATLIVIAVTATVVAILLAVLIQSALSGIYTAAVYRYAAAGETGGWFDEALVKNAFRHKG